MPEWLVPLITAAFGILAIAGGAITMWGWKLGREKASVEQAASLREDATEGAILAKEQATDIAKLQAEKITLLERARAEDKELLKEQDLKIASLEARVRELEAKTDLSSVIATITQAHENHDRAAILRHTELIEILARSEQRNSEILQQLVLGKLGTSET